MSRSTSGGSSSSSSQRGNFFYLLAGLLILLLLAPVMAGRFPWIVSVAYTLTLVVGVWSLARDPWAYAVGGGLAVASIGVRVLEYLYPSLLLFLLGDAISLAFCVLSTFILLRAVLFGQSVDGNRIAGAVCVYLLIGVSFALAYSVILKLDPNAFIGLPPDHEAGLDLLYFSFVTLTTLGFGDISPTSQITRALSYLEAVCGVMYVAILVASLIGSFRPEGSGAPPPP